MRLKPAESRALFGAAEQLGLSLPPHSGVLIAINPY